MKAASERPVETKFLLDTVRTMKPASILDVGYAGAKYLQQLLSMDIRVIGLDSDETRISGDSFKTNNQEKKEWKALAADVPVLIKDITKYPDMEQFQRYDMVISISSIEHIVPVGYQNEFDPNLTADFLAIKNMKQLVAAKGSMLVTIPCGKHELLLYNQANNSLAKQLKHHPAFKPSCKDIVIYPKDRIMRMISDWDIISLKYWTRKGGIVSEFVECDEAKAFSKEPHIKSVPVQSICGFHIRRKYEM